MDPNQTNSNDDESPDKKDFNEFVRLKIKKKMLKIELNLVMNF